MKKHMNVRQLLCCADAGAVVACAAYAEKPGEDPEAQRRWLEKYCFLYQTLTEVSPSPVSDRTMIVIAAPGQDEMDVSGIPLDFWERDGTLVSVEQSSPEDYSAMLVPDSLLNLCSITELAAAILCEYGWNSFDGKAHSPLALYRQARRYLDDLLAYDGRFFPADDERCTLLKARCVAEFKAETTQEMIMEAVHMPFSLYHSYCQDKRKMLLTKIHTQYPRVIRESVEMLKRLGYSKENIALLYYHNPDLFCHSASELEELLSRRGAAMTRYMLQAHPQAADSILQAYMQTDKLQPLHCPASRGIFSFAKNTGYLVKLKLKKKKDLLYFAVHGLMGNREGNVIYGCEDDGTENGSARRISYDQISWAMITDIRQSGSEQSQADSAALARSDSDDLYIDF